MVEKRRDPAESCQDPVWVGSMLEFIWRVEFGDFLCDFYRFFVGIRVRNLGICVHWNVHDGQIC